MVSRRRPLSLSQSERAKVESSGATRWIYLDILRGPGASYRHNSFQTKSSSWCVPGPGAPRCLPSPRAPPFSTRAPPPLSPPLTRPLSTPSVRPGPYQADRPQVHRWQGPAQAARHQGRPQVGPGHRRRQEAAPLPPRHGRPPRDPPLPEVDRAPHPQAPVPAPRPRDRPGLQDRPPLPGLGRPRAPGGRRGLPRRPLRGHQPLRDPRQARDHHAEGHPARPAHPRRALLSARSFCSFARLSRALNQTTKHPWCIRTTPTSLVSKGQRPGSSPGGRARILFYLSSPPLPARSLTPARAGGGGVFLRWVCSHADP